MLHLAIPVQLALLLEEAGQQPGHASEGWWGRRGRFGSEPERCESGLAMTRSALMRQATHKKHTVFLFNKKLLARRIMKKVCFKVQMCFTFLCWPEGPKAEGY